MSRTEVAREIAEDALVLAGLGALVYGCSLIWEPLPWIVGGAIVLAFGLLMAVNRARSQTGRR